MGSTWQPTSKEGIICQQAATNQAHNNSHVAKETVYYSHQRGATAILRYSPHSASATVSDQATTSGGLSRPSARLTTCTALHRGGAFSEQPCQRRVRQRSYLPAVRHERAGIRDAFEAWGWQAARFSRASSLTWQRWADATGDRSLGARGWQGPALAVRAPSAPRGAIVAASWVRQPAQIAW